MGSICLDNPRSSYCRFHSIPDLVFSSQLQFVFNLIQFWYNLYHHAGSSKDTAFCLLSSQKKKNIHIFFFSFLYFFQFIEKIIFVFSSFLYIDLIFFLLLLHQKRKERTWQKQNNNKNINTPDKYKTSNNMKQTKNLRIENREEVKLCWNVTRGWKEKPHY